MTLTRQGDGRILMGCATPYGPDPSWSDISRPDLEGEPLLATINGIVKVPPKPPPPGPRFGGGTVYGARST